MADILQSEFCDIVMSWPATIPDNMNILTQRWFPIGDIGVSLDQGSWPGNRWYFLGEYNTHFISFH